MTQSDDYEIETEIAIAMDEIASHEATLSQMLETVKFLSDQSFSTTQQAQTLQYKLEEQQSYFIEHDQKVKSLEHQL
jgi:hypothetical protein